MIFIWFMKLLVHTNPTFFRHDWIWHHQIIPYLQWLPYSDCPKIHKTTWYMLHYGGTSPKPLFGFCNSKHVGKLNQGRLQGWATKKKHLKEKGVHKDLVVKYVDSNGQKRWKGSPDLRSSESGSYLLYANSFHTSCLMSGQSVFTALM